MVPVFHRSAARRSTPGRRTALPRRTNPALPRRLTAAVTGDDGMTTAEYAVGTVAAVAFAGVLYKVVTSEAALSTLTSIVTGALHGG